MVRSQSLAHEGTPFTELSSVKISTINTDFARTAAHQTADMALLDTGLNKVKAKEIMGLILCHLKWKHVGIYEILLRNGCVKSDTAPVLSRLLGVVH